MNLHSFRGWWTAATSLLALILLNQRVYAGDDTSMHVFPPSIELSSHRAYVQLVVTAPNQDGATEDRTRLVQYTIADPAIAEVSHGLVRPRKNGSTIMTLSYGQQQLKIPIQVTHFTSPDPIRFRTETLPILTRQGCNSGSCHGSPQGKGGFHLSLFGYAPELDEESLVRGGLNRRVSIFAPEDSLILKKPLMRVAHVGGKRLNKSDIAYQILQGWITEGAQTTDGSLPSCVKITIEPGLEIVKKLPQDEQQLRVVATFTDGSRRDITAIASYDVSDRDILSVDTTGVVRLRKRGQAAVSVRYLHHLESVFFTVIDDVPGFKWHSVAEHNYVDKAVNDKLRQLQILPAPTCDDATFVRRIYLDLTGLLPGVEQVQAFLADRSEHKRDRLIDRLLASEEMARFWASKTADLLRVHKKTLKDGHAEVFANWIIDGWRENRPFDALAREMLTAVGDAGETPATNYIMGTASTEDLTETTAQLFMGSRIGCAKCHNHPFENWTQTDYYRIGAVFARIQKDGSAIHSAGSGEMKHPTSGEILTPWGLQGSEHGLDRRVIFSRWLTQPDNPFFARVEVNRIWAQLLGRGIVHPVDDFRSSNPAMNKALLDTLAQDFIHHHYDRKHIIRTICQSQTYQRTTATNLFNKDDEILFSHARLRRLSAEQIQDAVGQVAHTLLSTEELAAESGAVLKNLSDLQATIKREHPHWLETNRKKVTASPVLFGTWYLCRGTMAPPPDLDELLQVTKGAMTAANPPKAAAVWQQRTNWKDGLAHPIASEAGIHYLCRRIDLVDSQTVNLSLVSQAIEKIWLNGELIFQRAVPKKKQAPRTDLIQLHAVKGSNILLIRLNNINARTTFLCTILDETTKRVIPDLLDPYLCELLMLPEESLSATQKDSLMRIHLESDLRYQAIEKKRRPLLARDNYATQRLVPDHTEFLRTFGQPARTSPCACERSSELTVDQALQLLNGKTIAERITAGAQYYTKKTNDQAIEAMYLSCFARRPTTKESDTIKAHLNHAGQRDEALRDVLWALVNTREFLFQH